VQQSADGTTAWSDHYRVAGAVLSKVVATGYYYRIVGEDSGDLPITDPSNVVHAT
jgi:hypothetical protein